MKLPPEFWEWARENGLPPRGPRGSPENIRRRDIMGSLIARWKRKESFERREDEAKPTILLENVAGKADTP